MRKIYPYTFQKGITCNQLKEIAFDSHVDCYLNSGKGICGVFWSKSNAAALWKVYEAQDFFGEDWNLAFKQVGEKYRVVVIDGWSLWLSGTNRKVVIRRCRTCV